MRFLIPFKKYKLEDFGSAYEPMPTTESLRAEVDSDIPANGHDSAYDRKAMVVNKAMQDIGMGRYQWSLFVLCGLGWFADNLWLQTVAITLPSLQAEFGISAATARFATLSSFVGLCIGAVFWGITSDLIGRRPAFKMTLLLTGVFGMAIAGAPNWVGVCGLYAALGFGIGGNLPVDGALLLEFLPASAGNLLTLLSVFWPFGQLCSSLVGWAFLAGDYPEDLDWRYLSYAMSCATLAVFLARFFVFHLFESPKFLLSRGCQEEAVLVVRAIAWCNNTTTWLSEEILDQIGGRVEKTEDEELGRVAILKQSLGRFSSQRIKPLFAYKKLAINTTLLWTIWASIGLAYPLFNSFLVQYLSSVDPNAPPTPKNIIYRNYVIESVVGCPGSIIACYTVQIKGIGRRWTMAVSLMVTGIFLFLFTKSSSAEFQLGFSCVVAFFQNCAYGVLYAYSPETFPVPNRGTGSGISSFFNRVAGLCAPLVAIYGVGTNPKIPIYISGALFLVAFICAGALPIETMDRALV